MTDKHHPPEEVELADLEKAIRALEEETAREQENIDEMQKKSATYKPELKRRASAKKPTELHKRPYMKPQRQKTGRNKKTPGPLTGLGACVSKM
jgi:hypothetical protein